MAGSCRQRVDRGHNNARTPKEGTGLEGVVMSDEQILFEGSDLVVLARRRTGGTAVVTFGTRLSPMKDQFFARDLLAPLDVTYVCVAARANHWWQTAEMPEVLARIRAFLADDHPDVRVYGCSMGAFAALVFAPPLGAKSILVIAPVFTVDVGRDARWQHDIERRPVLFESHVPSGIETHFVYDRYGDDAAFVRLGATDNVYHYPHCGHLILFWLAETRGLGDFVRAWIRGDVAEMRGTFDALFRARRRNPWFYTNDRLIVRFCRRVGIEDVQAVRIVTHEHALARPLSLATREVLSYRLLFFLSNRHLARATELLTELAERPIHVNFPAELRGVLQYVRRGGDRDLARRVLARFEDIETAMPGSRTLYDELSALLAGGQVSGDPASRSG